MPHTGKPSGACQNCKKRHVKCDETRPACIRCVRTNRVCPGYAEGLDLVLRNQNEVAKAHSQKYQRPKSSQSHRSSTSEGGYTSVSPTPVPQEATISPYIPWSEDDLSVCIFIDTWASYPHDGLADRGIFELVPRVYQSCLSNSPFALCVAAISSSLFSKFFLWSKTVETIPMRRRYVKALQATREALQDPIESLSDETLMAVCLLGYYEACVESFKGKISSTTHFDGAAALIEKRQDANTTELGQRMLLGLRNAIAFRKLLQDGTINVSGSLYQKCAEFPQNPATKLDAMSIDASNLLARGKMISSASDEAAEVLLRAQELDTRMSTWPQEVPSHWVPFRLPAKDVPASVIKAGIYQDYCDVYCDITICSTWNSWRLTRLRVLSLIARLAPLAITARFAHKTIKSESHAQSEAIATIQILADDVCATVPFCLGNRLRPAPLHATDAEYPTVTGEPASVDHHRTAAAWGGWLLVTPMKQLLNIGMYLRPGQVAWVGPQLQRTADIYDVDAEDDHGLS